MQQAQPAQQQQQGQGQQSAQAAQAQQGQQADQRAAVRIDAGQRPLVTVIFDSSDSGLEVNASAGQVRQTIPGMAPTGTRTQARFAASEARNGVVIRPVEMPAGGGELNFSVRRQGREVRAQTLHSANGVTVLAVPSGEGQAQVAASRQPAQQQAGQQAQGQQQARPAGAQGQQAAQGAGRGFDAIIIVSAESQAGAQAQAGQRPAAQQQQQQQGQPRPQGQGATTRPAQQSGQAPAAGQRAAGGTAGPTTRAAGAPSTRPAAR
jgi:hypothetical protein